MNIIFFFLVFLFNSHLFCQDVPAFENQGRTLQTKLHGLLSQAKNPGTLGIGPVDFEKIKKDLQEIEGQLMSLKEKGVEAVHKPIAYPQVTQEYEEALSQKARIITFYFSQVSTFIQMGALVKEEAFLNHIKEESLISFPISYQRLLEFSDSVPFPLLFDLGSPLILRNTFDSTSKIKPEDSLVLELSPLYMNQLVQTALANTVTKDSYLNLVQFLLTVWLCESLEDISLVEINSKEISKKFLGFQNILEILRMKKISQKEVFFRKKLMKKAPLDLPLFASDDFIRHLVSLLIPKDKEEEYFKKYKELLNVSENVDFQKALEHVLLAYPMPLISMSDDLAQKNLLSFLAKAKRLIVESLIPQRKLSKEVTEELEKLFDERLKLYELELNPHLSLDWIRKVYQDLELEEPSIIDVSQKLKELVLEYEKFSKQVDSELEVNSEVLNISLERDFLMMGLEPATLNRKTLMVEQESLGEAFKLYDKILKNIEEAILIGEKEKSMDVDSEFQKKILEKIKKEKEEWLKIGELFLGYPKRSFSGDSKHCLSDLSLSSSQKENYRQTLKHFLLSQYPILMTRLKVGDTHPLYEKILEKDFKVSYLKEHQKMLEDEKKKHLSCVLQAKSIEELRGVIHFSPLLNVFMEQFPSFKDYHQELKRKLLFPTFGEMTWDETYHSITQRGFTFLLLHWLLKFVPGVRTHPLSRGVDQALQPYLKYYLISAFSMVGVNAVWQYRKNRERDEMAQELEEYFWMGTGHGEVVDIFTVNKIKEESEALWFQWKMDRAFEIIFFSAPVFSRPAKKMFYALQDRYFSSLFERVGFKSGNARWHEDEIKLMAKASMKDIRLNPSLSPPERIQAIKTIEKAKGSLLNILKRKAKLMERMKKHYEEEFKALQLEPGTWNPIEILKALDRLHKLHLQGLITDSVYARAVQSSQELLLVVKISFSFCKKGSPTYRLFGKMFFVNTYNDPKTGIHIFENSLEPYFEEIYDIDPLLERDVQHIVNERGQVIDIMMYKRKTPYSIPRQSFYFRKGNG